MFLRSASVLLKSQITVFHHLTLTQNLMVHSVMQAAIISTQQASKVGQILTYQISLLQICERTVILIRNFCEPENFNISSSVYQFRQKMFLIWQNLDISG